MATVNYYSHVPLIRIESEHRAFGPGLLWRLPFEAWNAQTLGAFEDHREAYEKTAPVFFYLEAEVHWPILVRGDINGVNSMDIKRRSANPDDIYEAMGFGFLTRFLDIFGITAQLALTLAAPVSAPASPRSSMTLCTPDDHYFDFQGQQFNMARIQGDADHEWLFLAEACGSPISNETIDYASSLWPLAEAIQGQKDLAAAASSLLLCSEPTLTERDQLLLATVAIEVLLLPEVRSRLKSTFVRRVANLLGPSTKGEDIERVARALYDFRSWALHGTDASVAGFEKQLEIHCGAQQLLASAVLALAQDVLSGVSLDTLRSELDDGKLPAQRLSPAPLDFESETGLRPAERLTHSRYTSAPSVYSPDSVMQAEEGAVASWSPLVGLGCAENITAANSDIFLVPINPAELVELEERDIRRDFVGKLRGFGALGVGGIESIACIGLFDKGLHDLKSLRRRRTDVVETLRLAGYSRFTDPALLGWYVYEGSIRYRVPTIFRQSILYGIGAAPEQTVSTNDLKTIEEVASLLGDYRLMGRSDRIDALLEQFLRAHPSDFVPLVSSVGLLFAIVEGALGRFRTPDADIQLEDLISAVVHSKDATWFTERARMMRNDIAHGRFDLVSRNEDVGRLLGIVRQVLTELLRFWVSIDERSQPPAKAFVAMLEARLR